MVVDKTIGELPEISYLDSGSLFVAEQNGEAVKVSGKQLTDFANVETATQVEQAKTSAQEAQAAKESAEAAILKGPIIQNGTWWVYNQTAGAYQDTGINATGPKGDTGPTSSVNGISPNASGNITLTAGNVGAYSKSESDALLANKIDAYAYSGAHNSIYRGKFLGNAVTAKQYAAIGNGSFDDLYIGDYWTISGVNYRIAAFNYYFHSGDNIDITTNHVTLVPDIPLYDYVMNDTDTTEGGYIGSKMNTSGLDQAVTTINNAFGSAHILTRREMFTNAVSNGKPVGCSWYDTRIYLMTEQNVYGSRFFAPAADGATIPFQYVVDKSQYPLFAFRPDLISNRQRFWLRDVVSAMHFSLIHLYGYADRDGASRAFGVRPSFSIKA